MKSNKLPSKNDKKREVTAEQAEEFTKIAKITNENALISIKPLINQIELNNRAFDYITANMPDIGTLVSPIIESSKNARISLAEPLSNLGTLMASNVLSVARSSLADTIARMNEDAMLSVSNILEGQRDILSKSALTALGNAVPANLSDNLVKSVTNLGSILSTSIEGHKWLGINNPAEDIISLPARNLEVTDLYTFPVIEKPATKEELSQIIKGIVAELLIGHQTELKEKDRQIQELQKEKYENWYCPEAGTGLIKNKHFKLVFGKDTHTVFNTLAKDRKVFRNDLIKLLGLKKDEDGNKSVNTYAINDLVKKIRKTTTLGTKELANNNGNIALFCNIKIQNTLKE